MHLLRALALLAALGFACAAPAASLTYCHPGAEPGAPSQDRLLQVAAIVKDQLEQSGQSMALISRSGLSLERLGQRYSHAGVSLKASPTGAWSVRQLYYACDEKRPRIFDQGMAGFVMGADDPEVGYISIVLLPAAAAAPLERAALDNRRALDLLGPTYSANAYAFSQTYQNCNQWLAELLAQAWGALPETLAPREMAQAWLHSQGYTPTVFAVHWQPLMWLARQIRWLHSDDHPAADLAAAQFRVSMPQSIEQFVQVRYPEATRLELCYTRTQVVLHRAWDSVAQDCAPASGDEVIALQQ